MEPETKSWWLADGRVGYNEEADVWLRTYLEPGSDPLWSKVVQYRARESREPARALLDFAYRDLAAASASELARSARPIITYRDDRYRMGDEPATLDNLQLDDFRQAQREIRRALVDLILAPKDADLEYAMWGAWIKARFTIRRSGAYTFGPAIEETDPPHLRFALVALRVLGAALPWLRHCRGCGRLFVMLRNQRFCSDTHTRRYAARSRREHQRAEEGRKRSRRGLRATYPEREIEAAHTSWIAMAAEGSPVPDVEEPAQVAQRPSPRRRSAPPQRRSRARSRRTPRSRR